MDMSSAGLRTKNDCVGEGQQQFTRQTDTHRGRVTSVVRPLISLKRRPYLKM
jgi:hypothetical protein